MTLGNISASDAMSAQAELHHQYLLGLELMVAARERPEVVGDWMFRLFRRLHEEKFLSSFAKLGLEGLPDAVACARYHTLSNVIGGVPVEYMEESDRKAWVRFRYPRWMFDGPAICGMPVEAGRGFLRGWYARNGVTLNNPRLGFVCVSEDMTGQFGFCGYFREYDRDLSDNERLVFAPDERPPPFDPDRQPAAPEADWSEGRLARANRNYAAEFIRTGIGQLVETVGEEKALAHGKRAARLTGLQQYRRMAEAVGGVDGGPKEAADFLASMFRGMGDSVEAEDSGDGAVALRQTGLRIVRGLPGPERETLLACWIELWRGAVASHRRFMAVDAEMEGDALVWTVRPA